jgi:hypothetical protein
MAANAEVLANYREQKKNLEKLATTARKQMQTRYSELLVEAAGIQADYKNDFGVNPDLPAAVKTFTLSDGKKKPDVAAPASEAVVNGKKVGGLRRSLNAAVKNGDVARANELATQIKELGGTVELQAGEPAADPAEEDLSEIEVAIPVTNAGDPEGAENWI